MRVCAHTHTHFLCNGTGSDYAAHTYSDPLVSSLPSTGIIGVCHHTRTLSPAQCMECAWTVSAYATCCSSLPQD